MKYGSQYVQIEFDLPVEQVEDQIDRLDKEIEEKEEPSNGLFV